MDTDKSHWKVRYPLLFATWNERTDSVANSDEAIVYVPATGDLHIVKAASAAILKELQYHSATATELSTVISRYGEVDSGAVSSEELAEANLLVFEDLGLIERVL